VHTQKIGRGSIGDTKKGPKYRRLAEKLKGRISNKREK